MTLIEWFQDSYLSSIRLPPTQTVEDAAIGILLGLVMDKHQDAHRPAVCVLWRIVVVQTLMVKPPLVNMEATTEPEINKQTHKTPILGNQWENSEKEKSPKKDPWHNWHIPEKASGTELVTLAQRTCYFGTDQQYLLLFPSESVVAEPHQGKSKLMLVPWRWESL